MRAATVKADKGDVDGAVKDFRRGCGRQRHSGGIRRHQRG